jgi:hypothetical protein
MRDLTRKQYLKALARNGFTESHILPHVKPVELPGYHIGIIYDPKTLKTRHRATLKHAIERRNKELAKRRKAESNTTTTPNDGSENDQSKKTR